MILCVNGILTAKIWVVVSMLMEGINQIGQSSVEQAVFRMSALDLSFAKLSFSLYHITAFDPDTVSRKRSEQENN